ncbi:hypothetical protein, conserved [Eimeria brunetti]|uniref:Uncharacterized protein n=1 Tax=Eimeria brunetti TaxID=51314 RepID=U6LEB3_9EIME|nr:hypothetical protein, conserved [Eimeria brunetti]
MQIAAAAGPGALPTSLQLPPWGDSGLAVSAEEVGLPVSSGNLQKRQNGGLGRLNVSAAALATLAALVVAYFALRCALFLASNRRSIAGLRYLAGSEETTEKEAGEHCSAPAEDESEAVAASEEEETEEVLVEEDLVKRARRYTIELADFIVRSEPLVRQLEIHLKSTCIAKLLCLSIVEMSALFTLLERRERAGMQAEISRIDKRIWHLRRFVRRRDTSVSRYRHIKCLHTFLEQLSEVEPAAAAFTERQRLVRIKQLLQLQELALAQLNYGLLWLREAVEGYKKAKNGMEAAAAAAHSAASAATRVAAATGGGPAADAAAAVAAQGAVATAQYRIAAVVRAIEKTVHKRRAQILNDALLSKWLRTLHTAEVHYGMISSGNMGRASRRPRQNHPELVEDLETTPLGLGNEPWERITREEIDRLQRTASTSPSEDPFQEDRVSPPDTLVSDSGSVLPLNVPRQGSLEGAGKTGSDQASSSPSTSAAAAAAPTADGNHTRVQATSHRKAVSHSPLHNVPSQVSPPALAWGLQTSAVSAASETAAAVSLDHTRAAQAPWTDKVPGSTSSRKSIGATPLTEALPRRLPISSGAVVSTAAAHTPEASGLPKPGAPARVSVAHPASARSWASVAAFGHLRSSTASHHSPAGSAQPAEGLKRASGVSGTDSRAPCLSLSNHRAAPPRPLPSIPAAEAWPSQSRETDGNIFQGAGNSMSESSALYLSEPQSVPTSPWMPAESSSPLERSRLQEVAGAFEWSHTLNVWGPFERAVHIPTDGLLQKKESAPTDATFQWHAKTFNKPPAQNPGEAMHPRGRQRSAASPDADAAVGAAAPTTAAAESPPASMESGEERRKPLGTPSKGRFGPSPQV